MIFRIWNLLNIVIGLDEEKIVMTYFLGEVGENVCMNVYKYEIT